jgi:hypothetical protein
MAMTQMSGSGNTSQPDIILQIDGVTIARVINPYSARETQRIGGSMIVSNG